MTTNDVPVAVRTALLNSIIPRNIISGFQVMGVYPFNRDIFSESEFLSSYTNRSYPGADSNTSKLINLNKLTAFPSTSDEGNFPDLN